MYFMMFNQNWIFINLAILIISALVIFVYALANYIYVPLFAFINKTASVRDSWRQCAGNRLRITGLLLILYLIASTGAVIFYFPTIYSINESENYISFYLTLSTFLNLYLGSFFAAAIGVSFLLIRDSKN